MTADNTPVGLADDPRDDGAIGAHPQTVDHFGNPLCNGCHDSGLVMAARANSGLGFRCSCPPADQRFDEPDVLAEARARMQLAVDALDRLCHSPACTCPSCDARRMLTQTA